MFLEYFKITGIQVAQIFLLAALGYALVKSKFLGSEGLSAISRLVMDITLPMLMFCQLLEKFSFSSFANWWIFPLLSVGVALFGLGLSWLFSFLVPGREHKPQFLSLVTFQNSGYLPLALIAALLPPDQAEVMFIYLFLFLIGFNALIFSLGIHMITFHKKRKFELASLFSPPVIAMSAALVLIFFGGDKFIPQLVLKPMRLVGDCTLPLAMLIIGGNLAEMNLGRIHRGPLALALLFKLVVMPVLGLILILVARLPALIGLLLLIQLAMPPATTLSVLVRYYKKEDYLVSQGIFFGHILSMISIPVFLSLYFSMVMVR